MHSGCKLYIHKAVGNKLPSVKVTERTDIPRVRHTVGTQRAELHTGFSASRGLSKALHGLWKEPERRWGTCSALRLRCVIPHRASGLSCTQQPERVTAVMTMREPQTRQLPIPTATSGLRSWPPCWSPSSMPCHLGFSPP